MLPLVERHHHDRSNYDLSSHLQPMGSVVGDRPIIDDLDVLNDVRHEFDFKRKRPTGYKP